MEDNGRERRMAILKTYEDVIAEHGKYATLVTKKSIYEEVADRTHYAPGYVAHVVQEMLREKEKDGFKL